MLSMWSTLRRMGTRKHHPSLQYCTKENNGTYNSPWVKREDTRMNPRFDTNSFRMDDKELFPLVCSKCNSAVLQNHVHNTLQPVTNTPDRNAVQGGSLTACRRGQSVRVIDYIVKFCENTSLRGVPRIVKTQDMKRRLLWSIFVFLFFVGCVTCLVFIITQYMRFDVIHQPKTEYFNPKPFPSFTVCNTRGLSSAGYDFIRRRSLHTPKSYAVLLSKFAGAVNLNQYINKNPSAADIRQTFSYAFSMVAYLENLPSGVKPSQLGHNKSALILRCYATINDGSHRAGKKCDDIGIWKSTLSEIYINCYTFFLKEQFKRHVMTVEIIVNVADDETVECHDCYLAELPTQLSGVRVQLHASGTYPNINEEGVNIMPGTFTEIRFQTKEWRMMEPPHGKCSNRVMPNIDLGNVTFDYSKGGCKNSLVVKELLDTCKCNTIDYPTPTEDMDRTEAKTFCARLPQHMLSILRNETAQSRLMDEYRMKGSRGVTNFVRALSSYTRDVRCFLGVLSKFEFEDFGLCPSPCTYFTYDTSLSTTPWPTQSFKPRFEKFLQNIIKKHPEISESLKAYTKIANLSRSGQPEKALFNRLKRLDYIDRNFLAISVSRPNYDIVLVEEKEVISLTSLLSQVGGLLSIWIGLTFVLIVEIFELFLNLAEHFLLHH